MRYVEMNNSLPKYDKQLFTRLERLATVIEAWTSKSVWMLSLKIQFSSAAGSIEMDRDSVMDDEEEEEYEEENMSDNDTEPEMDGSVRIYDDGAGPSGIDWRTTALSPELTNAEDIIEMLYTSYNGTSSTGLSQGDMLLSSKTKRLIIDPSFYPPDEDDHFFE